MCGLSGSDGRDGVIGLVYLCDGRTLAFAAVICLPIVGQVLQSMVSSMLAWSDTPERLFEQRMERACGFEYMYSPKAPDALSICHGLVTSQQGDLRLPSHRPLQSTTQPSYL